MDKKIELVKVKAGDIKTGFGNPRKITKQKMDELANSMEALGDFGIYLIDEQNNIIAGNMRLKVVLNRFGPEKELDCKRLIGYTTAELRTINIKDNTHSGDWDLDLLADWTADLTMDLGIDVSKINAEERSIENMEPIRFEKYNYVLIACNAEISYNELVRNLGIENAKVCIAKRKIKARAVWYDDMKAQIISKEDVKEK